MCFSSPSHGREKCCNQSPIICIASLLVYRIPLYLFPSPLPCGGFSLCPSVPLPYPHMVCSKPPAMFVSPFRCDSWNVTVGALRRTEDWNKDILTISSLWLSLPCNRKLLATWTGVCEGDSSSPHPSRCLLSHRTSSWLYLPRACAVGPGRLPFVSEVTLPTPLVCLGNVGASQRDRSLFPHASATSIWGIPARSSQRSGCDITLIAHTGLYKDCSENKSYATYCLDEQSFKFILRNF